MSLSIDRSALAVVNLPELRRRLEGEHFFVVTGATRGGTTALAYALVRAGIDLGPDLGLNLEDRRFLAAIDEFGVNRRQLASLFSAPRESRWGFKLPRAVFQLRWLDRNAPNPVFLIVLRSPLAVAKSALRHDPDFPKGDDGLAEGIQHALNYYSEVASSLSEMQSPCILLDYESLHYRADETLTELFKLLNLPDGDLSQIAAELSQPDYKELPR